MVNCETLSLDIETLTKSAPATRKMVEPIRAAPMDEVRWGLIGLGNRGGCHLETLLQLEGARIAAVYDPHEPSVQAAVEICQEKAGVVPYAHSGSQWQRMLERDDVDAVIISSPWEWHAEMAIAAMQAGKHAFVEVPAATTIEDCWALVDTAEATGLHCMLLENCNYGREELALLNMVRQGLFGELLHGEAAYIHDLRYQMHMDTHGGGSWRTLHYAEKQGNLYPSHGVGPLAHCMDVNRGDLFQSIVSMSTPARGRRLFAEENFPAEHRWNSIENWNCGDLNTSLIKLVSGRTMMVQWDETSPRPYTRHNFLQGTRGAFGSFPNRIAVDYPLDQLPESLRATTPQLTTKEGEVRTSFHEWDTDIEKWLKAYDHPLWKEVGEYAAEHGGHDGMDYMMFWRIQQQLRRGEPLDQSVYDAAAWSTITPLSAASVEQGGAPQKFPDFTRGKWRETPRVEVEG